MSIILIYDTKTLPYSTSLFLSLSPPLTAAARLIQSRMSAALNRSNDRGEQQDVYSRVTNKIIADLEKGELTWRQP
jgi:hypothetical protein